MIDFLGWVMTKRICIILPALNEESTVGEVIGEIPIKEIERKGYQTSIIVVDNGSTDRTRDVAKKGATLVISEPRRGKGFAIRAGFLAADSDYMFMLDSDYTYPARYLPRMLEVLESGYDVVLGSRLKGYIANGAMTRMNRAGNTILAHIANLLYGMKISDPCTGFWGFRGEVAKGLKLDANGFDIEVNMLIEIAKSGFRITEIPISYRRRRTRSKLKSLRDGLRIGKMLLKKRFRFNKSYLSQ